MNVGLTLSVFVGLLGVALGHGYGHYNPGFKRT